MLSSPDRLKTQINELKEKEKNHDFWSNKYFEACKAGTLTKDDFAYIFSQYFLYSRNFTRYLTAVMTNCESDYYRAMLGANLWEEGGGIEPEKRHSNIFRSFLVDTFGLSLNTLSFHEHTQFFYANYLDKCIRSDAVYGSAFLSLGTEGIVARMYAVMFEGMKKAGIPEKSLEFFYIHMACDDEHAETLEAMMGSYSDKPGWYSTCERAMDEALSLRKDFFNSLIDYVEHRKKSGLPPDFHTSSPAAAALASHAAVQRIKRRETPNPVGSRIGQTNVLHNCKGGVLELPTGSSLHAVVDNLPAGNQSNVLSSPLEALIYVLEGSGKVVIDDKENSIKAGDAVFVASWCSSYVKAAPDSAIRYFTTSTSTANPKPKP